MTEFKKAKYKGKLKHFSAGAIIKRGDKYLLLDRRKKPFGWAGPSGHIDKGETPREALQREVKEEVNLKITSAKLVYHKNLKFGCRRTASYHEWYVYKCTATGNIKVQKEEVKKSGWFTKAQLKELKLEPVWEHILKSLNIL